MRDALYIIARAPRVGFAKTRLGRGIGHERAVALYGAFLKDLARRFSGGPFPLGWYVTPPEGWEEIRALVGESERVIPQGPGDLTRRQRDLFLGAAARGEGSLVLVAADSPQLSVETVEEAFRLLRRHDVVVGPTFDGGYYLIGMKEPHDVLEGEMSTGDELRDLVVRAELAGLSVGILEATFDVDVAEDLPQLVEAAFERDDLPATREALERLGLAGDVLDPGRRA